MEKEFMKKYIILFFLSLTVVTTLLFTSCANENQGGDNSGGRDFGFTPGSPTDSNEGSDYVFDPANPVRGSTSYYSSNGRTNNNNDDPLYKSSYVLEKEERWGTSAPITITSEATFESFRLGEPLNSMDDIEDLRVYVKLSKTGNNYYGGDVIIAYWDNGRSRPERKITFRSGNGNNAKYNVWFRKNRKDYFHGFFQENYGSAILVIDSITPVVQSPDNPSTNILYSGSVWVMQFRTTFKGKNSCNNHDQKYIFEHNKYLSSIGEEVIPTLAERNRKCWFLTSGPYDCRTWRSGKGVNTFKAVNPNDNCYSKLGTFHGLNIFKAFNVSQVSEIQVHK